MNPLAALKIAWIAVYTVLGVNLALLAAFRRVGRDRALFGGMLMACVVYDIALLAQHRAFPSPVSWAESVRLAMGVLVLTSLVEVAVTLGDLGASPRWKKIVWWSRALAVVTAIGAASRVVFTGGHYTRRVWAFGHELAYVETELNVGGSLVLSLSALPMIAAFVGFYRSATRHGGWAWTVFGAFTLMTMTTVIDAVAAVKRLPVPYLTEHATVVFITAVSYAFIARAAEEYFRRETALQSTQRSLESVRETLAEREPLAALGELSALVAHEMRQPLTIIKSASATLKMPELAVVDRARLLQILDEECDRMNRVVTDLLTLAKPLRPRMAKVAVSELLERALVPAHRVNTEVEVNAEPDAEIEVVCDAQLMRHALENVVENAVQAMGPGGSLKVMVRRGARAGVDGREITIVDSGEGMNTEVRSKARKPFFTTRTNGTGLGLAIVDRILVAHHGVVEIESTRGEGTTVRLFLPEGRLSDPGGDAGVAKT